MNTDLTAMGGACAEYRAYLTAWQDNARGVHNGKLSCWGRNITDTEYVGEDGTPFPMVRPPNLDEKLGVFPASKILLRDARGARVTLQSVLENTDAHCRYMFPKGIDAKVAPDEKVAVRFQTQFVPLGGQASRKIAAQHYSYQTKTAADPCNAILFGNAQGLHAHADAPGKNRLLAHGDRGGEITEHWFVAEPTAHDVGAAQHDDEGAPSANKARAVEIGVEGMGPLANCAVCVSIPHTQTGTYGGADDPDNTFPVYRSLGATVKAARLSVDEAVAGKKRARDVAIVRDPTQPIVVTVMLYATVQVPDGAPARILPEDLALAVKAMERGYALAEKHGGAVCKLSELPAMLHKLEAKHLAHIAADPEKADPFAPTPRALAAFS